MALTGAIVTLGMSCERPITGNESLADDTDAVGDGGGDGSAPSRRFTFTCKGDFSNPVMRGYLSADGKDMTDLWVFDYAGGERVQTVHQTPADEDFGKPSLRLSYGSHHVYFVCSRGDTPSVDETAGTITWAKPSDTFWKDYEVDVVSTSNGSRAVTLDRVATRLRVTVEDEVPGNCASVAFTPSLWYYGLDYTTGAAVQGVRRERLVSVPASYAGTSGELSVSVFGLSGAGKWTADVDVQARDGQGNDIGSVRILNAPFTRNRSTEYSGCLFVSESSADVTLVTQWSDPSVGSF